MAQREEIRNFIGNSVCFFRPQKRDYFVLGFNRVKNGWSVFGTPIPQNGPYSLKRSNTTRFGKSYVNIVPIVGRGAPIRIDFEQDGYYIEGNNLTIPVLRPVNGFYKRIPASLKKQALIAPVDGPTLETDVRLWQEPQVPAPAPAPAPRAGPPMNVRPTPTITLEALPRRIAWLVAAEAEKQKETCAITFDEISPLTAVVTTCFHCFEADALKSWHETKGGDLECPLCKKKCLTTKAYVEETT
jgi:hypothetical protein